MARTISASAGVNAANRKDDVVTVQELLNKVPLTEGGPELKLKVDGLCWQKTQSAIRTFQSKKMATNGRMAAWTRAGADRVQRNLRVV